MSQKEKDEADIVSNFDTAQPALDPQSSEFSIPVWLDTVTTLRNSSPSGVANKRLSVCFANLTVHGSGTNNEYQRTFGNYPLALFNALKNRTSQNERPKILHSIDGVVGEREMLLVLGRPGSGCTTLLRTIAGDVHGLSVEDESALNYRGRSLFSNNAVQSIDLRMPGIPSQVIRSELQGDCIYTAETDVHFHELTVSQTLGFAVNACSSPGFLPGLSREKQDANILEFLLRAFNLRSIRDSKIGNELIRGVSGGEKRRVSLAEAFTTWSPLQCWDNSTRGLDSATALLFVRLLRNYTSAFGASVLMSVYQASESIYAQFDKVTVLYEGRQIFFGSCVEAEAYFLSIGFRRPENATTPDFLTAVTHPSEAVRLVVPGWEDHVPRTASEFRDVWVKSENFRELQEDMKAYNADFAFSGPHLDSFRSARRKEKLSL
ncbi:Multidrug resistance protein [Paraconiothyrium brasiliense]|uniref:Multidrug resistance protein n=1 Tax=Paraconiothyrium brasiliense TaxID=300254 RepID=A0ABR3RDD2_9PLEO